ncbi:hypothetical protein Ancab_034455 [Ancistrocladus abbreviatus]
MYVRKKDRRRLRTRDPSSPVAGPFPLPFPPTCDSNSSIMFGPQFKDEIGHFGFPSFNFASSCPSQTASTFGLTVTPPPTRTPTPTPTPTLCPSEFSSLCPSSSGHSSFSFGAAAKSASPSPCFTIPTTTGVDRVWKANLKKGVRRGPAKDIVEEKKQMEKEIFGFDGENAVPATRIESVFEGVDPFCNFSLQNGVRRGPAKDIVEEKKQMEKESCGFDGENAVPCAKHEEIEKGLENENTAPAASRIEPVLEGVDQFCNFNLRNGVRQGPAKDIVEEKMQGEKESSEFDGENAVPCAKHEEVEKGLENENTAPAATRTEPVPCASLIVVSRILKGMPQSPHFWPLRGYSDLAKNNLISTWDRIFEETTEQIQSMKVDSFWADAKRLCQTVEELQGMGYNVIPLRRRLVELTDVMLNLKKHKSDIMGLKNEAKYHRVEKSRLEDEIVKLKAKVGAEQASFESVMTRVATMADQALKFDGVFTSLASKMLA